MNPPTGNLPYVAQAEPEFVRNAEDGSVFYIVHGRARYVPTPTALERHIEGRGVRDVAPSYISQFKFGPPVPNVFAVPSNPGEMRTKMCDSLKGIGVEFGAGPRPTVIPLDVCVHYADIFYEEFEAKSSSAVGLNDARYVDIDIISDFENMSGVPEKSLDFIISCHVIEHVKSPLKVFRSAADRLKSGGKLVFVIPDMNRTFDRNRPVTSLDRLIVRYFRDDHERDFDGHYEFERYVRGRSIEDAVRFAKIGWESGEDIHLNTFSYESFRSLADLAADWFGYSDIWSHDGIFQNSENNEFYFSLTRN